MIDDIFVAKTKKDLKATIILILGEMWKLKEPKYKKVVVKSKDKEIEVAGFEYGNFTVIWDNLIKAKQILKNTEEK